MMEKRNWLNSVTIGACVVACVLIVAVVAVQIARGAMLTEDRAGARRDGATFAVGVAVANRIYAGGMVAINSGNYAVPAAASIANCVVGRAEAQADNSAGANGSLNVTIGTGTYRFGNQGGVGNVASDDDIGKFCYVVDDQTVSLSSSSGTRPPAGRIYDVDSSGVWVDFRLNFCDGAFSSSQLADGAVSVEHLDGGITPSHKTVVCNTTAAETDADAIVTEARSGIQATDIVVSVVNSAANATWVRRAYATSGQVNAVLNSVGGAGTTINFCVYNAVE